MHANGRPRSSAAHRFAGFTTLQCPRLGEGLRKEHCPRLEQLESRPVFHWSWRGPLGSEPCHLIRQKKLPLHRRPAPACRLGPALGYGEQPSAELQSVVQYRGQLPSFGPGLACEFATEKPDWPLTANILRTYMTRHKTCLEIQATVCAVGCSPAAVPRRLHMLLAL